MGTDWGQPWQSDAADRPAYFNGNGHWYGFTVNAINNRITRFDFGTNFDIPPVATNMGNFGGLLDYPTGICAVNDAGSWHVFISNAFTSTSLVRLDFGNSLLNIPVPVSLGNPNNTLNLPRDLTILKFCDQIIGYVVDQANDIVKLDFRNDLTAAPTATSLGNIGNFNFPHSISKIFPSWPNPKLRYSSLTISIVRREKLHSRLLGA